MCRLFGMISVEAVNARKYLVDDPCSLLRQSNCDGKRLQSDGWGVGYYADNGDPVIVKSEGAVFKEKERFISAVKNAYSRIFVAHIRQASNPRGLPKEKLISIENSQPFNYKRYIFAHNGTINIPDEVIEALGDWGGMVRGVNDSEVYFWYIVKEMEGGRSFQEALRRFKDEMSSLWMENRHKYPKKKRPYSVLNTILSDGERLYVYCEYDEKGGGEALCFKNQHVSQIAYTINSGSLIVASERTNLEDEWMNMRSGQILVGELSNGELKVNLFEI